jgi:hypothetical protein
MMFPDKENGNKYIINISSICGSSPDDPNTVDTSEAGIMQSQSMWNIFMDGNMTLNSTV